MPQLSSIQRPTNNEDLNESEDSSAAQVNRSPVDEGPELTILSIFSLISKFHLPSVDIDETGVAAPDGYKRRVAFGLGAGISCSVVLHQTGKEEEDVCSLGTFQHLFMNNKCLVHVF